MCFYCFFRFWRNLNVPCSPYLFTIICVYSGCPVQRAAIVDLLWRGGPCPVLNESSFAFIWQRAAIKQHPAAPHKETFRAVILSAIRHGGCAVLFLGRGILPLIA